MKILELICRNVESLVETKNKMPSVKVSSVTFSLLVATARELDVTVKDLVDMIVEEYFSVEGEEVEEEPEEEESEEEEEEEEEESED